MKTHTRIAFVALTSASLALCGVAGAMAAPTALTDGQLDRITAGSAVVFGTTNAQGTAGLLVLTGTTSNSLVLPAGEPDPNQPGLMASAGFSDGTATAVGTNIGQAGPTPTASASVQTGGAADGNQVISSTLNRTITGAGGVVVQAGWTVVFGSWVTF